LTFTPYILIREPQTLNSMYIKDTYVRVKGRAAWLASRPGSAAHIHSLSVRVSVPLPDLRDCYSSNRFILK